MAKSESRRKGTRSLLRETQLSGELWTKIGQHPSLKEWAKAAGTCSAAWGAQCMWSMDIMTDLPVAGTCHWHDLTNEAMHCILQWVDFCARDCKRQQEALHLARIMYSCAIRNYQPSSLKLTICPCRMAISVQEMLKEHCSSNSPHTSKCTKHAQSPQWRGRTSRARLYKGHAGHLSRDRRHR